MFNLPESSANVLLTENDENAHPSCLRELSLRIPEWNYFTNRTDLHKQWM